MATWAEFEAAAPHIRAGARLMRRGEVDEALLATVRDDLPPRINPIWLRVVSGHAYAFIIRSSAKLRDLEEDGRYALHTHQDPAAPSEFSVRGRARIVDDPTTLAAVAREWYFEIDDTYALVEFDLEHALLGERNDADEWPPRYTSWKAAEAARA